MSRGDTTAHENMRVGVCCHQARRSEVVEPSWRCKPAHEFGPGRRYGTRDCGTLQSSRRGRNFSFGVLTAVAGSGGTTMEVLFSRCCGLDVHKSSITACVRIQEVGGKPRKIVRRCGAMTADLRSLANWPIEQGVTHVAIAYASHCASVGR